MEQKYTELSWECVIMDTEDFSVGIFISLEIPYSLTVHYMVPVLLSCKPSLLSWKGSYQD